VHKAFKAAAKQAVKGIRQALTKAGDDDNAKKGKAIADGILLPALDDIAAIGDDLSTVAGDAGNLWLAEVKLSGRNEMFDRVNQRAVNYAKDRGAELVSGVDDATRNELADIVSDGLTENVGMDAIADRIEAAYSFSEKRADLIARTEIARANQNGVLAGMHEAKSAGVKIKKFWLPDAEACEECQGNGDDGAIDLDDNFSSGDDAPPAHPNCECTMGSEITETE